MVHGSSHLSSYYWYFGRIKKPRPRTFSQFRATWKVRVRMKTGAQACQATCTRPCGPLCHPPTHPRNPGARDRESLSNTRSTWLSFLSPRLYPEGWFLEDPPDQFFPGSTIPDVKILACATAPPPLWQGVQGRSRSPRSKKPSGTWPGAGSPLAFPIL